MKHSDRENLGTPLSVAQAFSRRVPLAGFSSQSPQKKVVKALFEIELVDVSGIYKINVRRNVIRIYSW
jgi:hypothetical protein